jgi:hypothetical protein
MNYKYLFLPLVFMTIAIASCSDDDNDEMIISKDNNFLVAFIIDQDTIRYEDSVDGLGNSLNLTSSRFFARTILK